MRFSFRKPHFWHPQKFAKTLFWHNVTLLGFSKIPQKTIKRGKTVKNNLDQFLTLDLDQFLTLETPNLGPVFNSTAYTAIYAWYIHGNSVLNYTEGGDKTSQSPYLVAFLSNWVPDNWVYRLPRIWESAKVSHKRVFALLTPEMRGWKMAQMLQKTSVRAPGLSTDEREHPFVWYFGALQLQRLSRGNICLAAFRCLSGRSGKDP